MASQAYYDWLDAGQPYEDCRPSAALVKTLRGHGYTVYTKGDASHMQAVPPEDHTPFSATGWPKRSARWVGHGIDIMPPPKGSGLLSLADLGKRLHDDKQAGRPGARLIKYMNWEPDGPGGKCVNCSWQPDHSQSGSTDGGHIHVSLVSDHDDSHEMDDYDPLEDDMPSADEIAEAVWNLDEIPAPKPPNADADYNTNPTWRGKNAVTRAVEMATEAARLGHENAAKLDQILAALSGGTPLPPAGTTVSVTGTLDLTPTA